MNNKLNTYLVFIRKLDIRNPYSIKKAIEYYKELFTENDETDSKESAFIGLRSFYSDVFRASRLRDPIKAYVEHLNNDRVDSSSIKFFVDENGVRTGSRTVGDVYVKEVPMPESIRKTFVDNGMHIYQNEGRYYVNSEPDFLFNHLKSYLPHHMREFLEQEAIENTEMFLYDMALMINPGELGERIAFWENFSNNYPDFKLNDEVFHNLHRYIMVFTQGVDNSPAFSYRCDAKPREIAPKFKKAYDSILTNIRD